VWITVIVFLIVTKVLEVQFGEDYTVNAGGFVGDCGGIWVCPLRLWIVRAGFQGRVWALHRGGGFDFEWSLCWVSTCDDLDRIFG
jgi:hypothetical protein